MPIAAVLERALSRGVKPKFPIRLCHFRAVRFCPLCASVCSSVKWGQGCPAHPPRRLTALLWGLMVCPDGLHHSKCLHMSSPAWGRVHRSPRHLFQKPWQQEDDLCCPNSLPSPASRLYLSTDVRSQLWGRTPCSFPQVLLNEGEARPPCFHTQ